MSSQQYLSHDTIHALASPTGGALVVLRISGPRAIECLDAFSKNGKFSKKHPVREVFRAKLHGPNGETLDDAMAVYFRLPRSHTGEDAAELYLHGGRVVAERVLEALESFGSRQALPGEFSFRAVRNGKVSITEAQAVADLISAKNVGAAALALEKMEGSQAKLITEVAEALRKLATMGELGIDFADQEVEELSLPVLKKRAMVIIETLRRLEGSFDRGQKIQEGIRAAFVGRPNAGKSSFFNSLLGEDRSIVSEVAGTTRDVVRETLTLRGHLGPRESSVTLRLEDTAGIRATTPDQIEKQGIERSIRSAQDSDLVVFVASVGESQSEWKETLAVWDAIARPSAKTVGILSKTDQFEPSEKEAAFALFRELGIQSVFGVSSTEAHGIHEASQGIVAFCAKFIGREPGEVLLTRLDHLRAVKDALTHLERALGAEGEDFFASDLRQALNALGPVIGETLPDDILGRIFSEFCIGK